MSVAALRVGVVGGGLIAQAVHLPNLAAMPERFKVAAIADPSPRVGQALSALYAPARSYLDWREMLEREQLDVLVVCSPHSTHAAVLLEGLGRGLHAFVEKPLCITVEDARTIADHARAAGLVVQVGYMKRFTEAFSAMASGLPAFDGLRLVNVVTYDPWMAREPFVPWASMTQADDIPATVVAAARAEESRQVEQAVGRGDAETVRAYSYTFLAALVHDVNLINGLLDALGVTAEPEAISSAHWAGGDAASGTFRLANGALWHSSWTLLRQQMQFQERVSLYFADGVHELTFPMPYDTSVPVVHSVVGASGAETTHRAQGHVTDPYVAELEHFHASVTTGAMVRTPPEQALRDLELLQSLFHRRLTD